MNAHVPGRYALYLDIGALRDRHYTGIPRVVFEIARHWWGRPDIACNLMIDSAVVPPHICTQLLAEGAAAEWPGRFYGLSSHLSVHEALAADPTPSIGLFPTHRKTTDAPFTKTVQIIHDLTTLLVPETHPEEMLRREATILDREVAAADHIVAVSDATRQHLVSYLRTDPDRITTVQLGVDPPQAMRDELTDHGLGMRLEPFALVLGTVELRKNLTLVLRHLRHRRELLRDRRWLFTGQIRQDVFEALRPDLVDLEPELRAGRIAFLGYVPEAIKHLLLAKADFAVYPSMFEGFGLPVAEALWHGCPVACSLSTSLPEVAREAGFYFDPSSEDELENALSILMAGFRSDREGLRRRARRVGETYTWEGFNTALGEVFDRLMAGSPGPLDRLSPALTSPGPRSPNRLGFAPGDWATDGVQLADGPLAIRRPALLTVHETAADSLHIMSQSVDGPGCACWSAALDVKPLLRSRIVVQIDDEHEHAVQATFDLRQGVVVPGSVRTTGQARLGGALIEPLPGGWWRCAVIGSPNVMTHRARFLVYLVEGEDRVHFPGRDRPAAMVDRAQFEAAAFPTPYRPAEPYRAGPAAREADVAPAADIVGACLGVVAGGLVRGWVWRRSDPLERLTVELHADGRRIDATRAVDFRPDLLALGKGDGCYGFSLVLPTRWLRQTAVSVVVAGERDAVIAGGELLVDGDIEAVAAPPDRGTITDIRFDESHRRWVVAGFVDRLPNGPDPRLEVWWDGRLLANMVASLVDPDHPRRAGFFVSIEAAVMPPETVMLEIVDAGTGKTIRREPFRIHNATADRPATIEEVLSAQRPTVDAILSAMPAASTQADAERALAVAYKLCLGRPPDEAGLTTYAAKLALGQVTPHELVVLLLGSPEARQSFTAKPILPPWL